MLIETFCESELFPFPFKHCCQLLLERKYGKGKGKEEIVKGKRGEKGRTREGDWGKKEEINEEDKKYKVCESAK